MGLLFLFVLHDGHTSGIYYSFYRLCSVCDLLIYSQLVTEKDTTLVWQLFVKNSYTEFHEKSVWDLVADIVPQKDRQKSVVSI